MDILLQYFDGCSNWTTTAGHLARLVDEGLDATVIHDRIESEQDAVAKGFHGSPTILVDGNDPFAVDETPAGLTCRIYQTASGPAGTPSLEQLRDAIARPGRE